MKTKGDHRKKHKEKRWN